MSITPTGTARWSRGGQEPLSGDGVGAAGCEAVGRGGPVLRLGMRLIDGLREEEAKRVVEARGNGFGDIHDLKRRSGVSRSALEKLAAADAFRSLDLDRRQGLWEVKAIGPPEGLPLFGWAETREDGSEAEVLLPEMALPEHVVNDYQTLRLSLKAHPMQFLRETLRAERVVSCAQLRGMKDGNWVRVAGVVLVRQRPGSAKGVVFMTLEDESGVANAVIWAKTLERYRKVVMGARLVLIEGQVQRHEDIIHVVSKRLFDRSGMLMHLSDQAKDMRVPIANADEVLRPDPGSARAGDSLAGRGISHPRWAGHPRNERIIPKSRDFH
jgi:error-prone DNA polymerase